MRKLKLNYLLMLILSVFLTLACSDSNVAPTPNNKEANFVTFTFDGIVGNAVINNNEKTITAVAKAAVNLSEIKPTFTLSANAVAKINSVVQVSGTTANNFTVPVIYNITSGDGTVTNNWTVKITQEGITTSDLTDAVINEGDKILKKGVYIVKESLTLQGGKTLTIEPGTVLKFLADGLLRVDGNATLIAKGTATSPIVFTSNRSIQKPGDWWGIRFDEQSDGCVLEYCTFEYGGGDPDWGMVTVASKISIKNCLFQNSKYNGLWLWGEKSGFSEFTNNTFKMCGENEDDKYPIFVEYIHSLKEFGTGNNFVTEKPNKGVRIAVSTLEKSLILKKINVPYIADNINITSSTEAVLTIEPGTKIKMIKNSNIDIREGGKLIAKGTATEPIVISGLVDQKGYWDYILLRSDVLDGNSLEYCNIANGGSYTTDWEGAIYLYGTKKSQITIKNCKISKTNGYGIFFNDAEANIDDSNTFEECGLGNTNK